MCGHQLLDHVHFQKNDEIGNRWHFHAYGQDEIQERHRHRFEVNNDYLSLMKKNGLVISGENPELSLVEMIEVDTHPWFVGVQFHPELKSRIVKAHPLFRDFIAAAIEHKIMNEKSEGNRETTIVHD